MITYDGVSKKLGFDAMSYDPEVMGTEYDGAENPFDVLSIEEFFHQWIY